MNIDNKTLDLSETIIVFSDPVGYLAAHGISAIVVAEPVSLAA